MLSLRSILDAGSGRVELVCPECREVKTSFTGFVTHAATHGYHSPSSRLPCPLCPTTTAPFPDFRLLKQHYWKVHKPKKLTCPSCPYRCSLERDLRFHLKSCPQRTPPPPSSSSSSSAIVPEAPSSTTLRTLPTGPPGNGSPCVTYIVTHRSLPPSTRPQFRLILPNGPLPKDSPKEKLPRLMPRPRPQKKTREIGVQAVSQAPKAVARETQTSDECDLDEIECLDFASQVSFHPGAVAYIPYTASNDFVCQTSMPKVVDASVSADYTFADSAEEDFRQAILLSTIETQTERGERAEASTSFEPPPRRRRASSSTLADLAEILGIHNEETQTPSTAFLPPLQPQGSISEVETQTAEAWRAVEAMIHSETQT